MSRADTLTFTVRHARPDEGPAVADLYRRVAAVPGGIAREVDEIDDAEVSGWIAHACETGAAFVAEDAGGVLIGVIHCSSLKLRLFAHMLGNLTIGVDPGWQGKGVGRALFAALMAHVRDRRPDISRVELMVRESNAAGRKLYAAMGFVEEGRMKARPMTRGVIEDDIPMAWLRG
jgi:ribosomal protein S18 acetylase RimI-like enzyme